MQFISAIIITAAVSEFALGFYILLGGRKKILNQLFALLSFVTAYWVITNIFMSVEPWDFWVRNSYVAGIFVAPTALIWIFNLVGQKIKRWYYICIYSVPIIFAFLTYFTGLIIKDVEKGFVGGFIGTFGSLYPLYSIYSLGIILYMFYLISLSIKKTTGVQRSQLKSVAIGVYGFATVAAVVNFVLPLFGITNLIQLDSPSSFIFILAMSYAIVYRGLFNIKVIAAELLTFTIWGFLLIQTLLADSPRNQFINGILLLLVVIFGVFLIKSVIEEVEQREKLEILTKELGAVNDRLVKLDKLKSEFLSFASHQVKTPITVVKGYASLIAEGNYGQVSEKIKEVALRIVGASDRMVSLVNSILDSRKIEEGRMEYKFGEVEVVALTNSVVADLRSMAERKGLSLNVKLDLEKLIVKADEEKLRQVIQNLLDNAIKYTDEGWIEVGLEKEADSLLISISDSGRGISQGLLPRIFEQWTRDSKVVREIQGTGLGLYIAKEIVVAHGGEIWAESRGVGEGSTFYVRLKLLR